MKYTDNEKHVVSFFVCSWVKIVQKGAGEIRAKYNFKNFPLKQLIFRWVNKFLATGSLLNNQTKLTNQKNAKKKTARTPETLRPWRTPPDDFTHHADMCL